MAPKREKKIPPPGNKKDPFTNFLSKAKWKAAMLRMNLDIPGRNIRGPGCLTISNAMAKNKNVTSIDFSCNHLGDEGAISLAQALKLNESLQNINLACNEITDVGGIALASAFIPSANPTGQPSTWNRSVYYLNLTGNLLHDDTLLAMSNAIACHRDFSRLDLTWNNVGPQGTKALMRAMSRNNLCSVILTANDLQDEGVEHLCEAWRRFGGKGAQTYLNLFRNNLGKGAGEMLGGLFHNNDFVSDVNLASNTLGCKGVQMMIAPILPPSTHVLKTLNLASNFVEDEGAEEVAKLIASNPPTLFRINVSQNGITDKGASAIGRALKSNQFLHILNLSDNDLSGGQKTTDQLLEVVSSTKSLKNLDLKKCRVNDDNVRRLTEAADKDVRVDCGAFDDDMTQEEFLARLGDIQLALVAVEAAKSKKKKPAKGNKSKAEEEEEEE